MYLSINFEGEVARLPIAGKAFLALIINVRSISVIIFDALAPCLRCIENLKCLQAQEGDDDAFEEHLHLYYYYFEMIF